MRPTSTADPPQRADAARNRAMLLDAARSVLVAQGLDASVEDIARAAGLGVGTVYRNFPTKDALVAAVIERAFDELTDAAVAALADPDPGESLFRLLRATAAVMARDLVLVRAARASDDRQPRRPGYVQQLFDATDAVVNRAIDAGALRPGITAEDIAALLIGIGEAANHPPGGVELAVERYVTILVDGLQPPPSSR